MRIIGRLPDPQLQISVFENDGRFIVQFEHGGLTQQYRFRKAEGLTHLGHVEAMVGTDFRNAVRETFAAMRLTHGEALRTRDRAQTTDGSTDGPASTDDLPTII